jgi:hypothetical protein
LDLPIDNVVNFDILFKNIKYCKKAVVSAQENSSMEENEILFGRV